MISSVSLSFGRGLGQQPLTFTPGNITVFVGPNNSGKTLTLKEILSTLTDERWANQMSPGTMPAAKRKIISRIAVPDYEWPEMRPFFGRQLAVSEIVVDLFAAHRGNLNFAGAYQALESGTHHPDQLDFARAIYKRSRVCMLDGLGRLNLVTQRNSTALNRPPQNHIQALLVDDSRRKKLQSATHEAFGFCVLIDPTTPGRLGFCTSPKFPLDPDIERKITDAALEFFETCTPIDDTSDGVKAYTGIIAGVLCTDYRVILIDEPEAFLHPPLARKLGVYLPKLMSERTGNVFAATHSADFLTGCIQSGQDVDVIRLTFENSVATARRLPSERLREMMRDPLLRSTGVLSSLFYRGAIVCEADADRAFYNEVNDRVLQSGSDGAEDTIFLNAQNWQTCSNIIGPLREMGIPAAAVVDLDVLLNSDFSKLMTAAYVPEQLKAGWTQIRAHVKRAFEATSTHGEKPADLVKNKGIAALDGQEREAAERLIDDLASYGMFVVPVGELERWLPQLGATGHGPQWLLQIFEKMKSDPKDSDYIRPQKGDVWDFIRGIAAWISDPSRAGVPR